MNITIDRGSVRERGDGMDETGDGAAWIRRAEELAAWTLHHLVVRHDAQGQHYFKVDETSGRPVPSRRVKYVGLDSFELEDHYRAVTREQVRGAHAASADEHCLFAVLDIDNHANLEEFLEINRAFALEAYREARGLGFAVLLVAGNAEGSFHLWVLFGRSNPMREAFRLCRWLVRDRARFGLPKDPDVFPQAAMHRGEKRMGSWIRLPGRHHKRPVWSAVWCPAREEFLAGEAAVAAILAIKPPPIVVAEVLPAGFVAEPPRAARGGGPAPRATPPLRSYERRRTIRLVDEALLHLYGDAHEYETWVGRGMSLTELGEDGRALFHDFSSLASAKYCPQEADAKWQTFAEGGDGLRSLGLGTIFHDARLAGWLGLASAARWEAYRKAREAGDPKAEALLQDRESEDDLADAARDARFSPACDEAVAEFDARDAVRAQFSRRWRISADTMARLGVGWRQDWERRGDEFVANGPWAWTIPISSGSGIGRPLTVGLLRMYPGATREDRLAHGSREGLILPWGIEDRPGPLVICAGVAATATALEAGDCVVGLTDWTLPIDDLDPLIDSVPMEAREIVIVPAPGDPGQRRAGELARHISHRHRRIVSIRAEPGHAALRPCDASRSRSKRAGFTFSIPIAAIKK